MFSCILLMHTYFIVNTIEIASIFFLDLQLFFRIFLFCFQTVPILGLFVPLHWKHTVLFSTTLHHCLW